MTTSVDSAFAGAGMVVRVAATTNGRLAAMIHRRALSFGTGVLLLREGSPQKHGARRDPAEVPIPVNCRGHPQCSSFLSVKFHCWWGAVVRPAGRRPRRRGGDSPEPSAPTRG